MYAKWFHWILSEFTDYNEQDPMGHNWCKSCMLRDFIGFWVNLLITMNEIQWDVIDAKVLWTKIS
jgi:hypothetical protein